MSRGCVGVYGIWETMLEFQQSYKGMHWIGKRRSEKTSTFLHSGGIHERLHERLRGDLPLVLFA
jgi:hypothetical protein